MRSFFFRCFCFFSALLLFVRFITSFNLYSFCVHIFFVVFALSALGSATQQKKHQTANTFTRHIIPMYRVVFGVDIWVFIYPESYDEIIEQKQQQ